MQTINTEALNEMRDRDDDLTVLNVLPPEEFYQRHIPGSENVPVSNDNFVKEVEKNTGGRNQPVVVYCASIECSASEKAAKMLDEAGFREVYDYAGGVRAWQEAGQPVQAGVRPG